MKHLLTAITLATFATSATAGSLTDPVIEAPVIVEEATSASSGTLTVALLALLVALPALTG